MVRMSVAIVVLVLTTLSISGDVHAGGRGNKWGGKWKQLHWPVQQGRHHKLHHRTRPSGHHGFWHSAHKPLQFGHATHVHFRHFPYRVAWKHGQYWVFFSGKWTPYNHLRQHHHGIQSWHQRHFHQQNHRHAQSGAGSKSPILVHGK